MKRCLLVCLLLLGMVGPAARADLPRTPIRGVPQVDGRALARFVLVDPLYIDRSRPGLPYRNTMMVVMLPGTFIPVTEDTDGIFYQAVNHYKRVRPYRLAAGGLYVSKIRPGSVWLYLGDAQMSSKHGVEKDTAPLPANILRHLKVGAPEGARR